MTICPGGNVRPHLFPDRKRPRMDLPNGDRRKEQSVCAGHVWRLEVLAGNADIGLYIIHQLFQITTRGCNRQTHRTGQGSLGIDRLLSGRFPDTDERAHFENLP